MQLETQPTAEHAAMIMEAVCRGWRSRRYQMVSGLGQERGAQLCSGAGSLGLSRGCNPVFGPRNPLLRSTSTPLVVLVQSSESPLLAPKPKARVKPALSRSGSGGPPGGYLEALVRVEAEALIQISGHGMITRLR